VRRWETRERRIVSTPALRGSASSFESVADSQCACALPQKRKLIADVERERNTPRKSVCVASLPRAPRSRLALPPPSLPISRTPT
jgi:hypothetical protein